MQPAVTSSSARRNLTFTNPAYTMDDFDVNSGTGAVDLNFVQEKLTARQRFANLFNTMKGGGNPRQRLDNVRVNTRERLTNAMNRMNPRERITNALNRFRRARQAAAAEEIPLIDMEPEVGGNEEPHIRPMDGSMPRKKILRFANLGKMEYPNVMRMVRKKIQRYKHGLMIARGVLGGAALVGGIVGGTLSQLS